MAAAPPASRTACQGSEEADQQHTADAPCVTAPESERLCTACRRHLGTRRTKHLARD